MAIEGCMGSILVCIVLGPTTMVYDPAYTTSKNCVEKLTEYLGVSHSIGLH